MAKNIGTVTQVIGPVLDIRFPEGCLPELLHAVENPKRRGHDCRRGGAAFGR